MSTSNYVYTKEIKLLTKIEKAILDLYVAANTLLINCISDKVNSLCKDLLFSIIFLFLFYYIIESVYNLT
jgi:hypothetical protein